MHRTLSVTYWWLLAWLCAGCHVYVAPGPTEPHALLKVRRVYHGAVRAPGEWQTREEQILIDGVPWFFDKQYVGQTAAQTATVRVAPGPRELDVYAKFAHDEQRHDWKTVTKTEQYTETEGYWEGTAYKTRSVTKTRSVPKQEWVSETVHMTDDKCHAAMRFEPSNGGVYLVQYTFTGRWQCSLVCLKQWRAAAGEPVQVTPCSNTTRLAPSWQ